MPSLLRTHRLAFRWLLLCTALLCLPSTNSLFVRFHNGSSCNLPLAQYSIAAPSLNYTAAFGATPTPHVCGSLPGRAGRLLVNDSCGVPVPANSLAYLAAYMYMVNSSDCSVDTERTVRSLLDQSGCMTLSSCGLGRA